MDWGETSIKLFLTSLKLFNCKSKDLGQIIEFDSISSFLCLGIMVAFEVYVIFAV